MRLLAAAGRRLGADVAAVATIPRPHRDHTGTSFSDSYDVGAPRDARVPKYLQPELAALRDAALLSARAQESSGTLTRSAEAMGLRSGNGLG